jgi:hypothetical protein
VTGENVLLTGGPADGEIVTVPKGQVGWAIPQGRGSGAPEKLWGSVFYRSNRIDWDLGLALFEFKGRD